MANETENQDAPVYPPVYYFSEAGGCAEATVKFWEQHGEFPKVCRVVARDIAGSQQGATGGRVVIAGPIPPPTAPDGGGLAEGIPA